MGFSFSTRSRCPAFAMTQQSAAVISPLVICGAIIEYGNPLWNGHASSIFLTSSSVNQMSKALMLAFKCSMVLPPTMGYIQGYFAIAHARAILVREVSLCLARRSRTAEILRCASEGGNVFLRSFSENWAAVLKFPPPRTPKGAMAMPSDRHMGMISRSRSR